MAEPRYGFRREKTFEVDCERIAYRHPFDLLPDVRFEDVVHAIQDLMDYDPFAAAWPLSDDGRVWLARFLPQPTLGLPELYVSFVVLGLPPNGMLALVHAAAADEIRDDFFEVPPGALG